MKWKAIWNKICKRDPKITKIVIDTTERVSKSFPALSGNILVEAIVRDINRRFPGRWSEVMVRSLAQRQVRLRQTLK